MRFYRAIKNLKINVIDHKYINNWYYISFFFITTDIRFTFTLNLLPDELTSETAAGVGLTY